MKNKFILNLFIVFTIVCAIICFMQIKNNKINNIEEVTEISQNEKSENLASDNEAHIMARTMTLIVNNIDEDGELIEESVNYSISAFNSNNVTNVSNPNGILSQSLEMPTTSGQYTINVTQTKSAVGYTSAVATKQITVDFTEVNGVINITSCSCGEGLELISNNSVSIKVKWLNTKMERKLIPIMFANEDENGDELNGAVFTIKDNEMLKIVEIKKDGCVIAEIPAPLEAKVQKYKVEQITAVDGYNKIKGECELNIKYEFVNGQLTATEVYFTDVDSTKVRVVHFTGILTQLTFVNSAKTEQQEDEDDEITKAWMTLSIKNKNTEGENLAGGKFIFEDYEGIKQSCITESDGKAYIEFISPNEPGVYTYKIEQVVAANGYNEINGKFELIISYKVVNGIIELDSVNMDVVDGVGVSAEIVYDRVVGVTFINEAQQEDIVEKELVSFLIANQNKNGEELNGATFSIKTADENQQVGIVKDGAAVFQLLSPNKAGKQTYIVEQLTAADGYSIIKGEMEFSVVYGVEDGKIIIHDAGVDVAGTSDISVQNIDGVMIQLTIINEEEKEDEIVKELVPFKIVNKNQNNEVLNGATFSIKVGEDGLQIGKVKDGMATFRLLSPNEEGTQTYKIEQLTAADGYNKINGEFELVVTYKLVDGRIEVDTAELNVVENVEISVEKTGVREIQLTFINEEQEEETVEKELVSFLIVNQNKNGEELNGATFSIKTADENQQVGIVKDGAAVFQLLSPNKAGKQTYIVEQLTAADGYSIIKGEMEFSVVYGVEDGKIIIHDAGVDVAGTSDISVQNIDGVMIQLTIINEEEKEDEIVKELVPFKIVNKNQNNEVLNGATFSIKVGEDGLQIGKVKDGMATFRLLSPNEEGTQTYKIEQLTAADGYNKIDGEFELVVEYEIINGKVEVKQVSLNSENITGVSAEKIGTKEIQVIVINDEEQQEPVEEESISFLISNENKNGDALNGATFSIKTADENQEVGIVKDGVALFQITSPTEAGIQKYIIEQLTSADGYSKINGECELQVEYEIKDGKIQVKDAKFNVIGNNDIKVHNFEGVLVELVFVNEEEREDEVLKELITFTLKNENQNGEIISGATFVLKSGEQVVNGVVDENGNFTFKLLSPNIEKIEKYTIEQVSVADGYALISGESELSVKYSVVNGKIVVNDAYSNIIGDYGLKVKDFEADKVNVVFINLEKENENDPDIEIRSVLFKITTKDKEENNIVEGTEYIISELLDDGKKTYTAKSDNTGVLEVMVQMPVIAGVVRYSVQQIKNPNGYVKDTNEYEIQLEYEENNGSISFVSAEALVECTYCLKVANCTDTLIDTIFVNKRAGEKVKLEVDGVEFEGDFIDKIKVNTSLKDFVETLTVDGSVEVFDAKGNKVDITNPDIKMGTGFKIQINEAGQVIEKEIIVVGDSNGDGLITISDVAAANKYFLGGIPYSEKLNKAFDVTGDGDVTISDVGKLNKYFLGAIPFLIKD